ncbi:MAG: low-specificity L-threonine aldolase [Firmicutes bacterium]|nr:low-specificity L-threonine aldolase [Bacillota bacterium]
MTNGKIDLRSDTVTPPTDEMRAAMAAAPVGDDVYGDDPTVNKLQKLCAKMLGKEAGLFVPSGTMSNQLALFTHCSRGDEVILPPDCHIVAHEAGAAAIIAGAQLRTIETENGRLPLDKVENTIRKDPTDVHQPKTALISYENADSNGRAIDLDFMRDLKALAEKYNIPVHLDGARIFNAAAALGCEAKDIAQYADTVSVCLSKGLCAPVGSVLLGSKEFIASALRKRKIMGGGMRQVGILAAAGIIALEKMSLRLGEDHENARYLLSRLEEIPGIKTFPERTEINMVFFTLSGYPLSSAELVKKLLDEGIIINGEDNGVMRFVTHNYVSREDIDVVIDKMKSFI